MAISQQQDRITKWILQQQTPAFLKLCSIDHVVSVRTDMNETIAPRRLPDGLMYVLFDDSPIEVPFIIEFESYPSPDNYRQMADSLMTYHLANNGCAEGILFILRPSPKSEPNAEPNAKPHVEEIQFTSRLRTSSIQATWRTIHLWEMQAEDLFAFNDAGIVPIIPLTQSTQSPETLLRRCRQAIDQSELTEHVKKSLRIVTELFASFVYNNTKLLEILQENDMVEFPAITRLKEHFRNEGRAEGLNEGRAEGLNEGRAEGRAEAMTQSILDVLETRFGPVPANIPQKLQTLANSDNLKPFVKLAAICPDLATFENALPTN